MNKLRYNERIRLPNFQWLYLMTDYQQQLQNKQHLFKQQLAYFTDIEPEIFPSEPQHFRYRVEFRVWHDENNQIHYVMSEPGKKINSDTKIYIDHFPIASLKINTLMKAIKADINNCEILKTKLFQIEFLSTLMGDTIISLIYHQKLTASWEKFARQLADKYEISIIGRSRKQKITIGHDYVKERLTIFDTTFDYHQYEQSFSQPNPHVCQKMIEWACTQVANKNNQDLLELYCGNGNFTLPLSQYFSSVLATEISKSGIKALKENIALNNNQNIAVARLSAEEFSQAFNQERVFRRLQNESIHLEDYQFSTVFVDPPRAGIDEDTLKLIQQFNTIIYISCNPDTLMDNLAVLQQTHLIINAAIFDQFPYTAHIESGIYLVKKEELCR